jgi:hypothetical protein
MEATLPSGHDGAAQMETALNVACLHCDHTEQVTPGDIVDAHRTLTFRAMSRVAAYSLFRLADGQITGGGSIYNAPTTGAMEQLGLPYWPLMHMSMTSRDGTPTALFDYQSAAETKKKAQSSAGYKPMAELLAQGSVSMADLEISTDAASVRQAIDDAMADPGKFGPYSRVTIPRPEVTNHG